MIQYNITNILWISHFFFLIENDKLIYELYELKPYKKQVTPNGINEINNYYIILKPNKCTWVVINNYYFYFAFLQLSTKEIIFLTHFFSV